MPARDLPIHPEHYPQIQDVDGIPLRIDTIYSNHKGAEKSGIRKNAEKALGKLGDILKKVLEPEEAILYILPGQAPIGELQQFTLGWVTYNITRTMLVVTNRRLLAFHSKPKAFRDWDWARRVRSIRFGDLAEGQVKGFLSHYLRLQYADGRKEKYWGLRGADAKKLRLILAAAMPGRSGEATAARGPVSLCPTCSAALEAGMENCRQCGQFFASEKEMWKRSILFPGGGYFYTGQTGLGILDAFAESMLIGILAVMLLIAAGVPDFTAGDLDPYLSQGTAAGTAGLVAVLLVLEKSITGYHGRHLVHDFLPLAGPPGTWKWAVFGGGTYAVIAGIIALLMMGANSEPISHIDPDIDIYRTDFGLFAQNQRGEDVFTSAAAIPAAPGAHYGFLVRFRTARPSVKLKTQFEIPGLELPPNGELPEGLKPHEEDVPSEGGIILRYWTVRPEEPPQQKLNVFLEGKLVRSFKFSVNN